MNVKHIDYSDIVVNLTRDDSFTIATVVIDLNNITIQASMRCKRTNEIETSDKILRFLGFSDKFIKGMKND